ncbi:unnamed protein product [Arctogadus glacialis]
MTRSSLSLPTLHVQDNCWGSRVAIKIENIGANISATPEGLRLTWKNPYRDKAPHCFESFIRFKTICAPRWENVTPVRFNYVLRTSRHKDYQFQIRMRYNSLCEPTRLNVWTSWTPTLSLGNVNDTGLHLSARCTSYVVRVEKCLLTGGPNYWLLADLRRGQGPPSEH